MPAALLVQLFRSIPGVQNADVFGLLRHKGIQAEVGRTHVSKDAKLKHVGAKHISMPDVDPPKALRNNLAQIPLKAPSTAGAGLSAVDSPPPPPEHLSVPKAVLPAGDPHVHGHMHASKKINGF
eukprot:TRINITY_DN43018_c0_g1_i1.p2 TRINITY_DN43018_c0_g1~~TRINITY_DN43018_c0_g1_i1.p2  ORF type:complete len:124 (+),score=33.38 TRINITY_DN43018_c0_g1_i1:70-441(+)